MTNLSQPYALSSDKASHMLSYTSSSVASRLYEVTFLLCLSWVRPHLEYHFQFGVFLFKRAVKKLERVLWR